MRKFLTLTLLLATLLASGCATPGQRVENLLAQDYATLSDPDLVTYFQQLNAELARERRLAREHPKAADEERNEALWARRNEVRQELGKRGLMP